MIGSLHGDVYSARPSGKRYDKAIAFLQGSVKPAVYLLLFTVVYGIGNVFDSRGNTVVFCIRYRHIDRRHGSFLIVILRQLLSRSGICRVCHISRRKGNLRRVILHDETVCRACDALCVRDISRRIGTTDVGNLALPVCGKDDLRPTILKLCRLHFRRTGRRRYGIGNLIRSAAFLRHRNIEDQALLPDDPVKKVRCLLLKGNFTDHRLRCVKLCSQGIRYCFIARCVHRLEAVGVLSLFQSVKRQPIGFTVVLHGTPCHGKLLVSAAIPLNIKHCHTLIVRIGKDYRQFLLPFLRILIVCRHCSKLRLCGILPLRIKGHILRQLICVCFVREMPCGRKGFVAIPALQGIAFLHRLLRSVYRLLPCLSGNRSDGASAVCIECNGQRSALRNRYLHLLSVGRGLCRFHADQNFPCCKT